MNRSEKASTTLAISFQKAKLIEHSMPQADIKNSNNAGCNTRKPLPFKNPFSNQEKPTKSWKSGHCFAAYTRHKNLWRLAWLS
jgi:hypothetical protein